MEDLREPAGPVRPVGHGHQRLGQRLRRHALDARQPVAHHLRAPHPEGGREHVAGRRLDQRRLHPHAAEHAGEEAHLRLPHRPLRLGRRAHQHQPADPFRPLEHQREGRHAPHREAEDVGTGERQGVEQKHRVVRQVLHAPARPGDCRLAVGPEVGDDHQAGAGQLLRHRAEHPALAPHPVQHHQRAAPPVAIHVRHRPHRQLFEHHAAPRHHHLGGRHHPLGRVAGGPAGGVFREPPPEVGGEAARGGLDQAAPQAGGDALDLGARVPVQLGEAGLGFLQPDAGPEPHLRARPAAVEPHFGRLGLLQVPHEGAVAHPDGERADADRDVHDPVGRVHDLDPLHAVRGPPDRLGVEEEAPDQRPGCGDAVVAREVESHHRSAASLVACRVTSIRPPPAAAFT